MGKQVWVASWGEGDKHATKTSTPLAALRLRAAAVKATIRQDTWQTYIDENGREAVSVLAYIGQQSYELFANRINPL